MERFHDRHQYLCRGLNEVNNLVFDLILYRAPLLEEDEKEVLCQQRITWGQKIFSPSEVLLSATKYLAALDAGTPTSVTTSPNPTYPTTNPADLVAHLQTQYSGNNMGEKYIQFCTAPWNLIFTRTPEEKFIPQEEYQTMVDPPQPIPMLTSLELGNSAARTMTIFFSFGSGGIAAGRSEVQGATPLEQLRCVQFGGTDVVLATISICLDNDKRIVTRPSLLELHTGYVDSTTIYTYKLTVPVDLLPLSSATRALNTAADHSPSGKFTRDHQRKQSAAASSRLQSGEGSEVKSGGGTLGGKAGILLRQAIQAVTGVSLFSPGQKKPLEPSRGGAVVQFEGGSGGAELNKSGKAKSYPFGILPPRSPTVVRYHVFGLVQQTLGMVCDNLYLRIQFIVPPKPELDTSPSVVLLENIDGERGRHAAAAARLSSSSTGGGGPRGLQPLPAPAPGCDPVLPILSTQVSIGSRVLSNGMYDTQHTFNFPFELHYEMPQCYQTPIRMVVTAFSGGVGDGDSSGAIQTSKTTHSRVEGYSNLTFSSSPGVFNQRMNFWSVSPTNGEFLRSYFLGGGPSLVDPEEAAIPSEVLQRSSTRYYAKAGLQAESKGSLQVQYFVGCHQGIVETDLAPQQEGLITH